MIFLTVKMPGKIFDSKKKDLLEKVSKSVADSLGIPVENVAIMIDDTMSADNFAIGGHQYTPLSKQLEQIFTDGQMITSKTELVKSEEIFTDGTVEDCIASSVGLTEEQKVELFDKLVNIANGSTNEDSENIANNIDYTQLKEKLGQTLADSLESTLKSPQLMKQTIDKFYQKIDEKETKSTKPKKTRKGTKK